MAKIMKLLLLFSFFSLDSLPADSILFAALDQYYTNQANAHLSEFKSTKKLHWLKYLPSVGITYTLDGHPRPSVSWSSNLIYTSHKDKEKRAAKQVSILQKNDLELQKAKLQLKARLQDYKFLMEDIAFMKSLLEYDHQLYLVKQDQAKHLEIRPSELVIATKEYRKKEYAIFKKERELLQLETQILIQVHLIHH